MNGRTFKTLKRIGRYERIDEAALRRARYDASPFVAERIDLILKDVDPQRENAAFDLSVFRDARFREGATARERLDEVAVTFLLFLASEVTGQKWYRTFRKPGSWDGETGWTHLFKNVAFSVFTLLYDAAWQSEHFLFLDEALADLLAGRADALRRFAGRLGVVFSRDVYPAEEAFVRMGYHDNATFGPYYWRALHWMAEAAALRDGKSPDVRLAARLWRTFTLGAMHRTLRCQICMFHYRRTTEDMADRFRDAADGEMPRLWRDVHDSANATVGRRPYPEAEFEADRAYMRSAL